MLRDSVLATNRRLPSMPRELLEISLMPTETLVQRSYLTSVRLSPPHLSQLDTYSEMWRSTRVAIRLALSSAGTQALSGMDPHSVSITTVYMRSADAASPLRTLLRLKWWSSDRPKRNFKVTFRMPPNSFNKEEKKFSRRSFPQSRSLVRSKNNSRRSTDSSLLSMLLKPLAAIKNASKSAHLQSTSPSGRSPSVLPTATVISKSSDSRTADTTIPHSWTSTRETSTHGLSSSKCSTDFENPLEVKVITYKPNLC